MAELLEISPDILAGIHDFDWAVRSLAHGSSYGRRQSRKIGAGMEFSQYRPYSQGDDLRQLDWKMYARSDKFYIKQSEVETHLGVTFVIDQSFSMKYQEQNHSKFFIARLLVAVLAFTAMQNGDRIGLAGFPGLPVGYGDRHWLRFLNHLQKMDYRNKFSEPVIYNSRERELFVVVSDMYEESTEWRQFVKNLNTGRNEVILLHLLGQKERTLDFTGPATFADLETGVKIDADPEKLAETYKEKMNSWIEMLSHEHRMLGIDYHLIDFTDKVSSIINIFLNRRKQLL